MTRSQWLRRRRMLLGVIAATQPQVTRYQREEQQSASQALSLWRSLQPYLQGHRHAYEYEHDHLGEDPSDHRCW